MDTTNHNVTRAFWQQEYRQLFRNHGGSHALLYSKVGYYIGLLEAAYNFLAENQDTVGMNAKEFLSALVVRDFVLAGINLQYNTTDHHTFIHSGHFYSASSSPLLLRGAPDYSTNTVSEFHAEAHRQL